MAKTLFELDSAPVSDGQGAVGAVGAVRKSLPDNSLAPTAPTAPVKESISANVQSCAPGYMQTGAVGAGHAGKCWWSLQRALWIGHDFCGVLAPTITEWAERNHPQAYAHLCACVREPEAVRQTLGAIIRRMRTEDAQTLEDAIQADPAAWADLRPYADRDEAEIANHAAYDRVWRGVMDTADEIVVGGECRYSGLELVKSETESSTWNVEAQ